MNWTALDLAALLIDAVQQHGHDMPVQVTDKLDGRKVLLSLHVRVIEGAEPPTIFQIEVR